MARVSTGIPGLDKLMEGGFIPGSANLVTGQTGCGKTIFGSQFLWEGLKKGEACVYISLEESPEDIKDDVIGFGWDFGKYEKKKLLKIIYHDPAQVNNLGTVIMEEIKELKAKRIVIDSTAVMGLAIESVPQIRKRILGIISAVKKHGDTTALLISEIPEGREGLSRFGVEEFVVDGVIVLRYAGIGGESGHTLEVRKMRRTGHAKGYFPLKIGKRGLIVGKDSLNEIMT